MGSYAKNWCVTLNNPSEEEKGLFVAAKFEEHGVSYCCWQVEAGEEGTAHIQAYVCMGKKKRMSSLKNWLQRAHFEVARGSPLQNKVYCSKEEGRIEGPWEYGELPGGAGSRTDLKAFRETVLTEEMSLHEMYSRFPDVVAKYKDFARTTHAHGRVLRWEQKVGTFTPRRGWQSELKVVLDGEPDTRTVHWYYETTGNVGKSYFARHYRSPDGRRGYIVTGGRHLDIYSAYSDQRVVFFDWARDSEESFPYRVIENFKNGYFLSTKYYVEERIFDPPHVVVFANYPPDRSKFSNDRWNVKHIGELTDIIIH